MLKTYTCEEADKMPLYVKPIPHPPYPVKHLKVTNIGFTRDQPTLAEKKLKMYDAWFERRHELDLNVS